MTTAANWLYHTAARAFNSKMDYACLVKSDREVQVLRGPDAMSLMEGDVAGWTLYTFREPTAPVMQRAEEAGIAAVFHVVLRSDESRLAEEGFQWYPATEPCGNLKPRCYPHVRRKVLQERLGLQPTRRPRDKTIACWLRAVAERAQAAKENYVYAVRDNSAVSHGQELREVLTPDVRGATLYSFRELTPSELGRAADAGIQRVYAAIRRRDAIRIGLWPTHLGQVVEHNIRQEMTAILEKWRGE